MLVPTSPSDVVDRITILRLKVQRLTDPAKVAIAQAHLEALQLCWSEQQRAPLHDLPELEPLAQVNGQLWEVEDSLRAAEREARFDRHFVEHARRVYRLNDRRAQLKAALDRRLGARWTDVKGYSSWHKDDTPPRSD